MNPLETEIAAAKDRVLAVARITVLPYEHPDHDEDAIVLLGIAVAALDELERRKEASK